MRALFSPPPVARSRAPRTATVSIVVHAGLIAALLMAGRLHPRLAPMRMPGSSAGTRLLPIYSLGGTPGELAQAHPIPVARPVTPTMRTPKPPPPPPKPEPTGAAASPGTGASGDAALGDGNINIALVRNHPSPSPDLSVLPHGTQGDVMLSIVIDAAGNITSIKVDRGLNPAIDQTVIATVQQWNFAPATRNGQPIASEQELLFHYVRS